MKKNISLTINNVPESRYFDGSMILIILSVLLFGSLSFLLWFTDCYNTQLLKILIIRKGSYLYDSWSNPPVSPLVCVYVFNYTNQDEFSYLDERKLTVKEVGPYCYMEMSNKAYIEFNHNGTVSYNDNRTHQFVPEMSKGNPNDTIFIPNVPFLSALALAKDTNSVKRTLIYTLLANLEPFSKVKVQDALFGYDNPIITIGNALARITKKDVPFEKFGILAKRSGMSKDRITIWTGEDDFELAGQVLNVNGITDMKVWNQDDCNIVSGSDGSRFPLTKVVNKEPVAIFSRDSCRSLPLVFRSKALFQKEIETYRYTLDVNYFNSSSSSCYCTPTSQCLYNGVFDISPCADGAPVLVSQPHFLNGDPELRSNVDGLDPDPEKHDFFLDIHPKYGLTLGTVSRVQINAEVRKANPSLVAQSLPDGLILPIVWMEISSQDMPKKMFDMVYHATFTVYYFEKGLMWTSLALFVIACICFIRRTKDKIQKRVQKPSFFNGGTAMSTMSTSKS